MSAIAGRVSRFSYRNLAISSVETSTPVGCRGAAPRRDAEGGEQNQNDGGRRWFVSFLVKEHIRLYVIRNHSQRVPLRMRKGLS